ncbi:hypothetical protein H4R21_002926 [Coemansia helicoidea]|uniref:Uncharacterized protein n=1 Tax=Coemansia helicoidea TaxID=1286919 RepID=A0ACC1L602_9FUNG|nr:hypothetical protein H4R21_002926 [Coemansia helicoidea]
MKFTLAALFAAAAVVAPTSANIINEVRFGEPGVRYGASELRVEAPGMRYGEPGIGLVGIDEHRGIHGQPFGPHHVDWNRVNDALNLDNDAINQQRNIINLLDRASYQLRSLRGTPGEHIHAEHAAAINEQRQALERVQVLIGHLRAFRH